MGVGHPLYWQIKLMSITQLVSTIHIKDAITLTLNSEFLNHNFDVVRQCLLRIKDLEQHITTSDHSAVSLQARVRTLEETIQSQSERLRNSDEKVRELTANVGDDFMKKMYAIEAKTKNMFDFDETARRLQTLRCFVLSQQFQQKNEETKREFQRVWQLREELSRYLPNVAFQKYKLEQEAQLAKKQCLIDECNQEMQRQTALIDGVRDSVAAVDLSVKQSNTMIGEINFPELLEKLKKLKDETEGKVGELAVKMKRKVGHGELLALETTMIERLDKFLTENQHSKAQKQQTKAALLFLQRKINDIEDVVLQKASEDDKDALFSLKKWQCASCTKDLGKFEGKMGQYRPWSIFPCKELDPEKSGGFGYLNYIDKMGYKKGHDADDPALDRLSRTFYDSKEKQSPSKKLSTTRGSNLINNYGSEQKGSSLKEVYFKDLQSQRKTSAPRIFRVTKKEGRAAQEPKEDIPQ